MTTGARYALLLRLWAADPTGSRIFAALGSGRVGADGQRSWRGQQNSWSPPTPAVTAHVPDPWKDASEATVVSFQHTVSARRADEKTGMPLRIPDP